MKIVIAPDKFKGSLSALQVCRAIENAVKNIDPSIETVSNPMADGGEGTVGTLVESLGGEIISLEVTGPLGDRVAAGFGMLDNGTAVIETASASGYVLVPEEKRNPLETTTYGTGELMARALEMGSRKIIIGIGGSATNDGGMGMAQALGYRFLGEEGKLLGPGGKQLEKLSRIDASHVSPLLEKASVEAACDVDNPLYGEKGAAFVYGPQKGAGPDMVERLDRGLRNFAAVVAGDLDMDVASIPGAGAAGGLGAGLMAFAGARLKPGADIIMELTGLEQKLKDSDLVITGEGAMDEQTYYGKSPFGVARLASGYGIPVITINGSLLAGRKNIDEKNSSLFSGNFSIINRPMSMDEAMDNAEELLEEAAGEIIRFYIESTNKTWRKR
jgi:glycerate 2-kinase